MALLNKNLLKQLPFYKTTIKRRIKEFSNAKLLSELLFFENPIKDKIKQMSTIKLLSKQPFYKQPIKNPRVKKLSNFELIRELHFTTILIFQEKKGHLESMPKHMK